MLEEGLSDLIVWSGSKSGVERSWLSTETEADYGDGFC